MVEPEATTVEGEYEPTIEGEYEPTIAGEYTPEPEAEGGLDTESKIFICFYAAWITLILGGNIMILLTLIRNKSIQTTTNTYVMSLICSDLCVGGLVVPAGILGYFSDDYLIPLVCRACQYFSHVAGAARIICMLTIATDRFRLHMADHLTQIPKSVCRRNIFIGWGIACLYAIRAPIIYDMVLKVTTDGTNITFMTCAIQDIYVTVQKAFLIIDFLCLYCTPAVLVITFYGMIVQKIRTGTLNNQDLKYSDDRRKRIIIMLVILMILFVICKLPIQAYKLYIYWGPGFFEGSERVRRIFELLSFQNSWLNVCAIMIFNDVIRKAVLETFGCRKNKVIPMTPEPDDDDVGDKKTKLQGLFAKTAKGVMNANDLAKKKNRFREQQQEQEIVFF